MSADSAIEVSSVEDAFSGQVRQGVYQRCPSLLA